MDLPEFRSRLTHILQQAQELYEQTNLDYLQANYGSLLPAKIYLGTAIGCMDLSLKGRIELVNPFPRSTMSLAISHEKLDRLQAESIEEQRRDENWAASTHNT